MSKKLNACFVANLFCCFSATISGTSIAAPPDAPRPTTRPTRPQFPATFDRATVQQLLDAIDQPQNASILKVGYFLRRGQPALPVSEGYELLNATLQAEKIGSDKWFQLQNLRAFTAVRLPDADSSDGLAAYDAIFDAAKTATSPQSAYVLRQSISEFVDAIPGKFNAVGLRTDERTRETLFKAWTAYGVALGMAKMAPGARASEPDWQAAITANEAQDAFVPRVETMLADKTVPPNFNLLLAAASLIAPKNPGRALAVLQRAKPLLPTVDGQPDVNQTARWYAQFVDLLVARERVPEAITSQQEFVALTGFGQAKLLTLLRKSGDQAASEKLLAQMSLPTAGEQQINDVAAALFEAARGDKATPENQVVPDAQAGAQAETLLKAYLAAARPRDVAQEIRARLALGSFYLREKQADQALRALEFTPVAAPAPGRAGANVRTLLREIEQMKQRARNDAATQTATAKTGA